MTPSNWTRGAAPLTTLRNYLRRVEAPQISMAVILVLLVLLIVFPLLFLFYGTFHVPRADGPGEDLSLGNYVEAFGSLATYRYFWNSVIYGLGHTVLAVTTGTFIAWVAERTNTPGRRFIYVMAIAPMIVPGILNSVSWIFLLSPRIGLINRALMALFNLETPPFNIFSLPGMIFESGLHWSPFVFLIMGAAFKSLDPSLEEAAYICGAPRWRIFSRITLRMVAPALYSAMLIMFVRALSAMETPLLLGIPARFFVLTTEIYLKKREYPPNYGLGATYSLLLMAVAVVGLYFYTRMTREASRFAAVTGKGYRPHVMDLGPWRYLTAAMMWLYFSLVLVLPFLVMFWFSLFPSVPTFSRSDFLKIGLASYAKVLSSKEILNALWNSAILALGSAAVVMALTVVIAWLIIRTKIRGRWLLDNLASSSLTIPGVVLAMAMIWTYTTLPIPIYGTLMILMLAYVVRYIPYGMRYSSSSLIQISVELEEAAQVSGANWLQTMWRILVPLLRPALVAGSIYVMLQSVKEFSTSVMLYTSGNEVISVIFYDLWAHGFVSDLAAIGVVFMITLMIMVAIIERVSRRFGIRFD